MRNFQVVLGVLFGVAVFLLLDYALPSRTTVRITETYNKQTVLGWNRIFYAANDTGTVQSAQGMRDIRYINTVRPNGKPLVYRNEDTGTVWPPYFKYDSSNLHAIAGDMRSTADAPRWVSVTSYGWRIAPLTVFPNAVSVRPVSGPTDHPLNWPAMVVLALLGGLLTAAWRGWNRFRARRIDPGVAQVHRRIDALDARVDAVRDEMVADARETKGRIRGWWRALRR